MKSLVDNARSFTTHVAERAEEFSALEAGQSPEVLFITCSDSRVVPSLITGARPGELFELRTAGNIVPEYSSDHPAAETATIEYAVRVLGVRDIIVCGHSHCGAVNALVSGGDLSNLPAVQGWLERAASQPETTAPLSPDVAEAVQLHAVAQLERLHSHPCIAERVAEGTLAVHAWYYEVHTGAVQQYGPDDKSFRPL
ncbi:carbonic anhydrase [Streptomyces sp. Je 1-4]|uniref:carbonic anhydrase n=1 Tax=Streptomyces TaxID=1883 RepID=UPI0021D8B733|nr:MULTISPECIES: carbonic anhydrase [unclassified Streptomyces]UYB40959.1 carbonic anhydrase [Streptomyces sp. Je 1-4]UZQ37120.1 carbonic anhydrase [Streptomyces sp. Je 1-4] [Streptomyces sp. Je 1-4 4N24]UZQ44537.1 carbonic anhydrase [Streptomyces sp. Je 1-4] [Streptomyces sp. Je 1-4 4N24_ara]